MLITAFRDDRIPDACSARSNRVSVNPPPIAPAAKTCRRKISIERRAGQFGSARFEVVQNIFKGLLRVFACGIALAGDQLQLISILCEQAEIAFGAAEIASENHWSRLPAVIAVLLAVTFHPATCKRGGPLAALLS